MRKLFINLAIILASTVVALLAVECSIRIGSLFHKETWADKQQKFIDSLTVPFSYGLVRPNAFITDLRAYFPSGELQPNPIQIKTNRYGMRMRDIEIERNSDTTRIAVLGDSCTFGWMIPEENAYPRVLETILNNQCETTYEVLNFGVPGYTSFHGLQQYRNSVKQFRPNIIILAYGFNDSYEFRFPEKEFYEKLKTHHLVEGLRGTPLFLYDQSALFHWSFKRLQSANRRPIEQELHERAQKKQWFPRVNQDDYQLNVQEIIEDIRLQGGEAILLNLDLPNTWVKHPSRDIAERTKVRRVDVQDLFDRRNRLDERIEPIARLIEKPGVNVAINKDSYYCTFRVWVPPEKTLYDSVYLLINSKNPAWPWQKRMSDDGTSGDEIAGDGVWSLEVRINTTELLDYSFLEFPIEDKTTLYENSPKALRFYHHIDLNALPSGSVWSSPIHVLNRIPFERLMVPGDVIHPNAEGHQIIADELAPLVLQLCEGITKEN